MISRERCIKNITDSLKEIASSKFQEKGWVKIDEPLITQEVY